MDQEFRTGNFIKSLIVFLARILISKWLVSARGGLKGRPDVDQAGQDGLKGGQKVDLAGQEDQILISEWFRSARKACKCRQEAVRLAKMV